MPNNGITARARDMRTQMLISLAKVRDAEQLYDKVKAEYTERENKTGRGFTPDMIEKLAEQNCDRDPIAIKTAKIIAYHTPRAMAYALAYQVETHFVEKSLQD
jgi:hypothetical protein